MPKKPKRKAPAKKAVTAAAPAVKRIAGKPLDNARHERACIERVAGKTELQAFQAAGYKPDEGNATRLFDRPDVKARVVELKAATAVVAVQEAGLEEAQVVRELERIAFADIRKVMRWGNAVVVRESEDEDGKTVTMVVPSVSLVPSEEIPDDVAAAIGSVSQKTTGEITVKMHSKLGALIALEQRYRALRGAVPPGEGATINVTGTANIALIDAPPRETHEEWMARRGRELARTR